MNLETHYLGLRLKNPLVVGASPYCDNLTACLQLEEAGVAALTMHSFFEEQVEAEERALAHHMDEPAESHGEALSYFPRHDDYQLGADQYLRQLRRLREALTIPIIASLNGTHLGRWVENAKLMELAGAAALELNLYQMPTDPAIAADQVEADMLDIVRAVVAEVEIPVAVKLSPYHSALANFVKSLAASGAAGVVLFNRFYQPDFDIEELEAVSQLRLSDSSELLLRLRWLAILSAPRTGAFACSGGVHTPEDFIKALLAGADVVQVVSAFLKYGPQHARFLLDGLTGWMEQKEYTSVDQMRGALNLIRCPDPSAHERANYLRILQSWKV